MTEDAIRHKSLLKLVDDPHYYLDYIVNIDCIINIDCMVNIGCIVYIGCIVNVYLHKYVSNYITILSLFTFQFEC